MFGSVVYSQLRSGDETDEAPLPSKRQPQRSSFSRRIKLTLTVAVTSILALSALLYYRRHHNIVLHSFGNCGTTPSEARQRGCLFELHNFAWVPPACYDHELADAWDARTDWLFSHDDEGRLTISKEIALRGELPQAFVPWGQHLAHCALVWRKHQRAVMFDWPMDNWTSSYAHADHCATNLVRRDLDEAMFNSLLHLKFPECDYGWKVKTTPELYRAAGGGSTGHEHDHGGHDGHGKHTANGENHGFIVGK